MNRRQLKRERQLAAIFAAQQRVDIARTQLEPMTQDDPRLGAAMEEFHNALEARLEAEHAGGR